MTIEVKHPDLQKAVKDINSVLGTSQNHISGRQVLINFIVGAIGGCIGPDPDNPGEQVWSDERAGQLKAETLATYEALASQPELGVEPAAAAKPKECPEFGKGHDPADPECAKPCKRAEECQAAMAAAPAGRKTTESRKTAGKPGVIVAIFTLIKSGPHSKVEMLAKLKEQFPDRDEKAMKSTINVQIPSRMAKEKAVTINKNESGQYYVT